MENLKNSLIIVAVLILIIRMCLEIDEKLLNMSKLKANTKKIETVQQNDNKIKVKSETKNIETIRTEDNKIRKEVLARREALREQGLIAQPISENAEEFLDFHSLNRAFYTNLKNCNKMNGTTGTGLGYEILGSDGNTCSFISYMGPIKNSCKLPLNISQKYAKEGLRTVKELDELKAQNKSGFVQASNFINEISNNRNYCTPENIAKK